MKRILLLCLAYLAVSCSVMLAGNLYGDNATGGVPYIYVMDSTTMAVTQTITNLSSINGRGVVVSRHHSVLCAEQRVLLRRVQVTMAVDFPDGTTWREKVNQAYCQYPDNRTPETRAACLKTLKTFADLVVRHQPPDSE